jgi:hypothetical protein
MRARLLFIMHSVPGIFSGKTDEPMLPKMLEYLCARAEKLEPIIENATPFLKYKFAF